MVFLALVALYESWSLPLAIVLIVPMTLMCALGGVWLRGGDNNIFTQIALLVLVGLACKNAILSSSLLALAKSKASLGLRLRLRPAGCA